MPVTDFEVDVSDEERALFDLVHRFAAEVLRPAGRTLDALADPADVIAPGSVLWDVFSRYRALGIDELALAGSGLPPERQARLRCVIGEELGWGDAGLAIGLGVSNFPRMMALLSGDPELIECFGGPEVIGCWPATEPDHGSDLIVYGGHFADMPGTPNCVAVRDGGSYLIRGQKSAWVSNATIATAAALFCAVDEGDGPVGIGGLLVPLDAPGVSRGRPLDKIGQRALNQGELFFDDVRVPANHLVLSPAVGGMGLDVGLATANAGMGSTFTGLAQAAFDLAVAYTKDRVQGGVPISQHQSVRSRLFGMFRKVEAARGLNRRAILVNALGTPNAPLSIASKVTSTQAAFEVASDALQLFGGNGLAREQPIEKLLRDARASMIEDGCNEVLGMVAAERLVAR